MMGLVPGHLVRALFHFTLKITLVVSVAEYMAFLFRLESSQLVDSLSRKNKRDKNKKRRKDKKGDSLDSSLNNDSDSSFDSDYKRKRRKN